MEMGTLLAALSALMSGGGDFLGGMATRNRPAVTVLVYSQLVGLVLASGAAVLMRQDFPSGTDVAWGAAAGVCGAAGLVLAIAGVALIAV